MGRLEIIKATPYSINCDVLLKDFKWLIEQAELTEVSQLNLLGTTTLLDETIVSLEVMAMRNARLREALAFYENPDNYSYAMGECENPQPYDCVILGDCGQVAKSALEETK